MDPAMQLEVAAMSRQQIIRDASALGDSDVQRFYCGRVVFLTGGSGFLGKQLIEKLLRTCNITRIYMLLRSKKQNNIHQRLENILQEPVFDVLRQMKPDFADKIKAVEGDVSEINLGLSSEDWKTFTEEVNVIFHVAATTKFDETLRVATLINLRGTRECLKLGRACKNLRSYVHVSTAYTHAKASVAGSKIYEKFYRSPVPPDTMISMAENMENDRLKNITANLIKDWPNTYCFTKALAEELIRTSSDGLPICIVRPGVVICTYREPSAGWLDMNAVFSASGIIVGTLAGVMHTIKVDGNINIGLIPCDYVNNTILAAGKEVAVTQARGGDNTVIYTLSPTYRNPILWKQMSGIMNTEGPKITSPLEMYYAFMLETKSTTLFMILSLFLHMIPAQIADFVCLLMGKERKFVKQAKKMFAMSKSLSYFMMNQWVFVDQNTRTLYNSLSKQDKDIFNFDVSDVNWRDLIIIWMLGIRKYILKDGLKKSDNPVNRHKALRVIHYIVMAIYAFVLWKTLYFVFWIGTVLFQTLRFFLQLTNSIFIY